MATILFILGAGGARAQCEQSTLATAADQQVSEASFSICADCQSSGEDVVQAYGLALLMAPLVIAMSRAMAGTLIVARLHLLSAAR